MRFAGFCGIALLLLSMESVLVQTFGFDVTRIDVCIALVVYAAVRSTTLEGAFISFSIGYLLDVFTGRPTGLYPFLSVLVFLVVRGVSLLVDVRSRPTYALAVSASVVVHGLLVVLFTSLTSVEGGQHVWSLAGLPAQAVLSGLAALALFPLLRRIEPGDRPDPRVIRS